MPKISEVLAEKGGGVVTIPPETTVYEAIDLLTEKRIGSLIVTQHDGTVAGIITERDVLRIVKDHLPRVKEAPVSEFMSRDLVCAVPNDDLDYAMNVMTENRIRRLPVMDGSALVGIISIGDVVKALRSVHEYEVRMLRDYIASGTLS